MLGGYSWHLMLDGFSKLCQKNYYVIKSLTGILGTLHEDLQRPVYVVSWILLGMTYVPDKSCIEKWNTYFMSNKLVAYNPAIYEIMSKKYGRPRQATDDSIMPGMKDAICMPDNSGKNTDTLRILLLLFHGKCLCNAPHCYIICTLPVLLYSWTLLKWHVAVDCSNLPCIIFLLSDNRNKQLPMTVIFFSSSLPHHPHHSPSPSLTLISLSPPPLFFFWFGGVFIFFYW